MLLPLLLLTFAPVVDAQTDCAEAPTPALRIVCEQLHKWDANARASPPVTQKMALPPAIPGLPSTMMAAELAPIATNPYQCMDLGCLCSYMGGNGQAGSNSCTLSNGRTLTKALRKEYRMLSDDERDRYHSAVRAIKQSGEYDRLAVIHSQFASAGSAHSGPGFLPWHRVFTSRFETAIRLVDPTLAVPYWDSTLDGNLPTPRDSIIFSDAFMGQEDGGGMVVNGPFAQWRTLNGRPNIARRTGAQGSLFKEADINYLMAQTQIENVLAFTAPRQGCPFRTNWNVLEYSHGNPHIWVGGDMLDQSTSANDPIFFIHHSFVDLLWELWRQQRQSRFDREVAYPADQMQCASAQHFGSALMRPFEPWRNVDGLSNKYTDNLYEFAPRPTCTGGGGSDCESSKYLFCDRSHGQPRCTAKVRVGGNCQGFIAGESVCSDGVCQGGICVATAQPPPESTRSPPIVTSTLSPPTRQETCFNEHECCSGWAANGECSRNPGYMSAWCKASCGICTPTTYDLRAECADRHPNCGRWSASGECTRNTLWMNENCRSACRRCDRTRAQVCSGGGGGGGSSNRERLIPATTAPLPSPVMVVDGGGGQIRGGTCESTGCFNENICCQFWGLQGRCARSAPWMSCNCKVSCGYCIPQDYFYGSCDDYHKDCQAWASDGQCGKNPWMLENCRASCQSCLSGFELREMCRGGRRRFEFLGRRRRGMFNSTEEGQR